LGSFFANKAENIEGKLKKASQAKTNAGLTGFTDLEIREKVAEELRKEAPKVERAVVDAARGDSKAAKTELKDITDLAGAAGTISEAFGSGSPLRILSAMGGLISNSIVGKYLRAAFQWIVGKITGKNENFGDIMARINFDAGMSPVAKLLGVDNGELTAGLLSKEVPVVTAPVAAPPAAAKPEQTEVKTAPPANTQETSPANPTPPVTNQPVAPVASQPVAPPVVKPEPLEVVAPVTPKGTPKDKSQTTPPNPSSDNENRKPLLVTHDQAFDGAGPAVAPLPRGVPPAIKTTVPPKGRQAGPSTP